MEFAIDLKCKASDAINMLFQLNQLNIFQWKLRMKLNWTFLMRQTRQDKLEHCRMQILQISLLPRYRCSAFRAQCFVLTVLEWEIWKIGRKRRTLLDIRYSHSIAQVNSITIFHIHFRRKCSRKKTTEAICIFAKFISEMSLNRNTTKLLNRNLWFWLLMHARETYKFHFNYIWNFPPKSNRTRLTLVNFIPKVCRHLGNKLLQHELLNWLKDTLLALFCYCSELKLHDDYYRINYRLA